MTRMVRVGEVAVIEREALAPGAIRSGTVFVGLEHIESSGEFSNPPTVGAGEIGSTKFQFGPDHLLYGKLRPYLSKIARPTFVGVCSTDILPIRPSASVERDYLFHYLRSPPMIALATRRSEGANLPRLSPRTLAEFEMPLPSLEEQRRIASILDKADGIRRRRREALKLTDELLRSTFLEICCLGHPNYASWPLASIESLAKQSAGAIRSGPFGSALLHSEFVDEGIAVLGIDNAVKNRFAWDERRFVTPEKYEELRRYTVHPGDVIITIMGTTGRSVVVPDDIPLAITTKHLATITPDASRVTPEFLAFSIHTNPDVLQQIAKANRGAIMAGLNLGLIRALSVRVPPIAVQRTFTHFVRAHGQLRQRQEHALSEAESLFSSLSQQFFSPTSPVAKREAA